MLQLAVGEGSGFGLAAFLLTILLAQPEDLAVSHAAGEVVGGDPTHGADLGNGAAAEAWGSAGVAAQPGVEVIGPLKVQKGYYEGLKRTKGKRLDVRLLVGGQRAAAVLKQASQLFS